MTEFASVYALLLLILIVSVNWRIAAIERQSAKILRLEAKLDLLLKHAGVAYNPYTTLSPDVAEALRNGQKIEAIKRYRNATGVGLKDAKDFIEEAQRHAGGA
jgi:ribosomal protein L7/L12